MSEVAEKKAVNENSMGRLTVVLFAICAVCALVLGLANMLTKDKIAENQMAEKMDAMQAVLAADKYEPVNYTGADETILSVYKGGDAGYVIEVNCAGGSYSGTLSIMVGVNADNTVAGLEILTSAESSGLGDNAKDPAWRAQFVGKSGQIGVTKDGGEIEAISGATMTSRSVTNGVNAALAAAAELG